MTERNLDLAGGLDLLFVRFVGWIDGGRIRHRPLAGRLALAARLADTVLVQEDNVRSSGDSSAVTEHRNLPTTPGTDMSTADWQAQFDGQAEVAASVLETVSVELARKGVWRFAPTITDRLLRRRRFADTNPDEVRSQVSILTSGRRAEDGRTAVLQELIHSYAPSSSDLTWWTTDPNFPIYVPGVDRSWTKQLATLFEAARATGPRYAPNAAAAAEAGWRPTLPG